MTSVKQQAFSLIELLTVLAIVLLCASTVNLSPRILQRTAKQEAERVLQWLYSVTHRADRTGNEFNLDVTTNAEILLSWKRSGLITERIIFPPSNGFKFIHDNASTIRYSAQWGTFTPGLTLTIKADNGSFYYVILSGQGQMRISDTPPVSSS